MICRHCTCEMPKASPTTCLLRSCNTETKDDSPDRVGSRLLQQVGGLVDSGLSADLVAALGAVDPETADHDPADQDRQSTFNSEIGPRAYRIGLAPAIPERVWSRVVP